MNRLLFGFGRNRLVDQLLTLPGTAHSFFPWDVVTAAFATEGWDLFADRACAEWDPQGKRLFPVAESRETCDALLSTILEENADDPALRLTDSRGQPIWPLLVPLGLKTDRFHRQFVERLSALRRYAPARLPGRPLGGDVSLGVMCCVLVWMFAVAVRWLRSGGGGGGGATAAAVEETESKKDQ